MMNLLFTYTTVILCALHTSALPKPSSWSGHEARFKWTLNQFSSLVTFGDSYTDDSRSAYFAAHGGQAPPVGYDNPINYNGSDGGRLWPRYVGQYTGLNIYNYAVRGAVCSNDLTPRLTVSGNATYLIPSVEQYEIPAFLADAAYSVNGSKFLSIPVENTVYVIWIGTNDVGNGAFLTDSQKSGNLTSYVDCVYDQYTRLYNYGARRFVLMNLSPLNLLPLYALPSVGNEDTLVNATETSYRMLETVATINDIYYYRTAFQVSLMKNFPGSQWALFNVHDLLVNIYNDPSVYLNGTAALNVTGYIDQCNANGSSCVRESSPDSYMWFNNLHPSEQTQRVIAQHFVDVLDGTSKYASYWS